MMLLGLLNVVLYVMSKAEKERVFPLFKSKIVPL